MVGMIFTVEGLEPDPASETTYPWPEPPVAWFWLGVVAGQMTSTSVVIEVTVLVE